MLDVKGIQFVITGNAYYCCLNKPNTKGNYPSNCYEVGISNPEFKFKKDLEENDIAHMYCRKKDDRNGNKTVLLILRTILLE